MIVLDLPTVPSKEYDWSQIKIFNEYREKYKRAVDIYNEIVPKLSRVRDISMIPNDIWDRSSKSHRMFIANAASCNDYGIVQLNRFNCNTPFNPVDIINDFTTEVILSILVPSDINLFVYLSSNIQITTDPSLSIVDSCIYNSASSLNLGGDLQSLLLRSKTVLNKNIDIVELIPRVKLDYREINCNSKVNDDDIVDINGIEYTRHRIAYPFLPAELPITCMCDTECDIYIEHTHSKSLYTKNWANYVVWFNQSPDIMLIECNSKKNYRGSLAYVTRKNNQGPLCFKLLIGGNNQVVMQHTDVVDTITINSQKLIEKQRYEMVL